MKCEICKKKREAVMEWKVIENEDDNTEIYVCEICCVGLDNSS